MPVQCVAFSVILILTFFGFRYGYHITKNSYFICHDQETIKQLFERLRNYSGENSYPKECGSFAVTAVRDLTTGYDSNQSDNKAVCTFWLLGTVVIVDLTGSFLISDCKLLRFPIYLTFSVVCRYCQPARAVRWSPSPLLMGAWLQWGPVGQSPKSNITLSSVLHRETGFKELTYTHEIHCDMGTRSLLNTFCVCNSISRH